MIEAIFQLISLVMAYLVVRSFWVLFARGKAKDAAINTFLWSLWGDGGRNLLRWDSKAITGEE